MKLSPEAGDGDGRGGAGDNVSGSFPEEASDKKILHFRQTKMITSLLFIRMSERVGGRRQME